MLRSSLARFMTPPQSPTGAQRARPDRSKMPMPGGGRPQMAPRRPNYLVPSSRPQQPSRLDVGQRPRRRPGNREVLRRALSPPVRRRGITCCQRRWNFHPTPSRLSNMSRA